MDDGASTAPVPGRVFISYRREEAAYPAGWLYDRLANRYGGQVFKDVDSIQLGDDFVEVITRAVGSCDVLLALIGDQWLTITDEDGRRRLDDPDDFVRLEIEAALARNVRVIPILVDGAELPPADELPPSLAGLVRRQALELSPARFDFDTGRLLKVLDQTLAELRATSGTSSGTPTTAAEDRGDGPPRPDAGAGRRRRLVAAAAAALALVAAGTVATVLILNRGDSTTENWRLVITNKKAVSGGCNVTVTNTDTGDPREFLDVWGQKTFQMQTRGPYRWEADDPGCQVVRHSGAGKAELPFSWKAGTGDTDVFTAPDDPGVVVVDVLAFNTYSRCDFELHDAEDGQLLDLGTVPEGGGPLRLEPNGRSQVYLSDFAGCDIRVSAQS